MLDSAAADLHLLKVHNREEMFVRPGLMTQILLLRFFRSQRLPTLLNNFHLQEWDGLFYRCLT